MIFPYGQPRRRRVSREWFIRLTILSGLSLLALLVLFPHLQTGFTTRDDAEIGLLPAQYGGWQGAAWAIALGSGRFSHLLTMPAVFALFRCYLVSPPCFYFLYLGSILLNFVLFYFLVRQLTGSKRAGFFAVVLGLAFQPNNWQHNLLTSYPVIPHLGLSALFCTFICLLAARENRRPMFVVLAGIAYFVSLLVSEAFILYFPVLLGICLYHARAQSGESKEKAAEVARLLSAVAIGLAIYLVCYVAFRHFHPSQHDGNRLAPLSLGRIAAVIWQYTSSTAPGYFYFFAPPEISNVDEAIASSVVRFPQLFERCRWEWLVKAIVASLLSGLILWRSPGRFTLRSLGFCFLGGMACLVAPVFLVSLTPQYQDWVLHHRSLAYGLPSYAAYFATSLLLATLLMAARQASSSRPIFALGYTLIVSTLVGAASLATDLSNYPVTVEQQRSHRKWRMVDRFIGTAEFRALPEGAIFYGPTLWRGPIASGENYWTEYISQRSGKKMRVVRDPAAFRAILEEQPDLPGYFLAFGQDPRMFHEFLILARPEKNVLASGESISAREFVVFSAGGKGLLTVTGECSPSDRLATVQVNGRAADRIEGRVFSAQIEQGLDETDFPKLEVRSDVPIDLNRITVSARAADRR